MARARGRLVLLKDGSLAAIGGDMGQADATIVHGLSTNGTAWSTLGNLDSPVMGQGATAASNNGILQFGGQDSDNFFAGAYVYEPLTGNINSRHAMAVARADFASAWDGKGRSYAFGGVDNSGVINAALVAGTEQFDPATGQWTPLAPMPTGCGFCSAAWDGKDSIFVFTDANMGASVLRYTISTDRWTTALASPLTLNSSAALLAGDGRIYLLGGMDYRSVPSAAVQAYDPQGNVWTMEQSLPAALSAVQAAVDVHGRIVVAGGYDSNGAPSAQTWISQPLQQSNAVPVITSTPVLTGRGGTPYAYILSASGYPAPAFVLTTAPAGMTLTSGVVSWTPNVSQIGPASVAIKASNSQGSVTQNFIVNVLAPVPGTPTGFAVKTLTSVSAALMWNPISYAFGPVTYTVYQSVASGGRTSHWYWAPIASGLTTPSYTMTRLTAGYSYGLALSATSAGGTSPLSTPLYFLTLIPGTPTGLTASAVKATSMTLSWKAGKGTEPTATYSVFTGAGVLVQGGIVGTRAAVSGLTPSTTYTFFVVAYDSSGSRAAGTTLIVSTLAH